jgi:threonine-phosphate decarboxylase
MLHTARPPWALGTPAARVGTHCLQQHEFVEQTRKRVREQRRWLREALTPEYEAFPSDAPFLLLGVGDREVEALVTRCREAGVAIRDATTFRSLDSHVRVAVRTREENKRLVEVLST